MPFAAFAQDDDEGFLTSLIQDNLSGDARTVDLQGFNGALSSEATIDRLTVADADGIWLTLEDITLTWNRRALLRGAIDVEQLAAERIIVARAPLSEDSGPAPEAQPFALPELPVSISLGALDITEIVLGDVFLGEEIRLSLTGAAELGGGEGTANIVATRLGDQQGVFEIDGSYANATRVLDILLKLEEAEGGIAAGLLGLPGQPSVALEVAGAAPLDDFAATLAIGTDGQDRLAGTFALSEEDGAQRIALDIAGDISPLFTPEYQGFFGNDASLRAQVVRAADGQTRVPELALDAGRVALNGQVALDAQGWPTLINLNGGITALGNDPVLLPLSGPRTFVDGMDISVLYDTSISDDWQADIAVANLTRPGLSIANIALDGGGLLRPGDGAQTGAFTAEVDYGATGLRLSDAGAAQAFGDEISGALRASRLEGGITNIAGLTLSGAGLDAVLAGTIAGPDAGFETDLTLEAEIAGLDRFATLAGQDIGGAAQVSIAAVVTPADGGFDITLDGQTDDLSVGIAQADAVLAGLGQVDLRAVRDTEGTRLERLSLRTDAARLTGSADLTSTGADAQIDARLNDIALVLEGLNGPATVTGTVVQAENGVIRFDLDGTGPAATFRADGTATPQDLLQNVRASLRAEVSDLSHYAEIANRPLAGAVTVAAEGQVVSDLSSFDVTLDAQTTDVATGIERLDPFIAGAGQIAGRAASTDGTTLQLSDLDVVFPAMRLDGNASLSEAGDNSADLNFRVTDAQIIDPSLSGPVFVDLTATPAEDGATATVLTVAGAGAQIAVDAIVASAAQNREITGEVTAQVADLSAYAALAGQPIAGAIDLTASGRVMPDLSGFDARVRLRSEDLGIGNETADALLAGTGRINADVGLSDGVLALRTLEVSTREVSIVGALNGAAGFGQGRFNASLRDVGLLTDQISGPVRATGSASLDEQGNWGIDASGTGPGGLRANVAGQLAQSGNLDIDIDGSAPLALANTAIDPRRLSGQAIFDLSVNGPPALSSLSGQIGFSEGRLSAPNLGQALRDITGQIALTRGNAQIDIAARVDGGGRLAVNGPVALTGSNQADVDITLTNVALQDPELYATRVSGRVSIDGPLQGNARISGRLSLGQTDVQVPSSSISPLGDLPQVQHLGASDPVRTTLARAGLQTNGQTANEAAGGGGPNYALDLVINAPSRIFIRGRGLDAELGGSLSIGGTTRNVIPSGRFELQRGRIDILQQRFELTEGVASLQGDFVPFIRLVATTETDTGTVINIIVEGPASAPVVSFLSVPELPQDEVLSQLIFGRDLQSISPLQAVQLASAISTLAGRGGGAIGRLRDRIGLDDFDVTTDDEGAAAVRAGKYLSDNVYTDVTVTSEGDTEINLNLDLTDEITATGSVDQDGETGIGLFFQRDY
ncbi:translocation/assembly module TamB domain-containing protein [Yoonia sp.]|uniref:translocation/assembly module TamB domain-containing protein n=1 Tax=Yoonia sp. TaxID=2212373 RepID=UPI003F4A8E70